MRKSVTDLEAQDAAPDGGRETWLDLDRLARVEVSSEDPAHPVEGALVPGAGPGWRAAAAGEQTIRLLFDEVRTIRRIQVLFRETQEARTQEFVLRWSPGRGQPAREIVRQQYNFSPPDGTRELEDYTVKLSGVGVLELRIVPDVSRGSARASVERLRIA